jgi:hypothetical protein
VIATIAEEIRCGPGARAVPFAVAGPHLQGVLANVGPPLAVGLVILRRFTATYGRDLTNGVAIFVIQLPISSYLRVSLHGACPYTVHIV